MQCNVHEAKTNLSQLLNAVDNGELIEITRNGKCYRLLQAEAVAPKRLPGLLRGQLITEDNWDSPELNAEIAREMGAD